MRHTISILLFLIALGTQAQQLVPKGGERVIGNVRNANPAGMYSLPTVAGGERIPLITGDQFTYNSCGVFNGEHYIVTSWSEMFGSYFVYHYLFDPNTWESRGHYEGSIGTIGTDMDYNKRDKRIYGCFRNDSGDGYVFGYIEMSGAYWYRGEIAKLSAPWVGFAIHPNGTFYAITNTGRLCTVDPSTGETDEIGSIGVSPRYVGSATISAETGTMYFNLVDAQQDSYLYTIDMETAEATMLYKIGNGQVVYGMYVPQPLAANGAPAQVTDFSVSFIDDALDGKASFTAPAESYDGTPLTGSLTYEITLNNNPTPYVSGNVEAGRHIELDLKTVSAGMYNFSLRLKNAYGYSPESKQSRWIGKDTPSAPTNVSLTYDKASQTATIKWNAPTTSQNNGYVDFSKVTYLVVRYPEAQVVANATTGTSLTDPLPLPDRMTQYYYTVQASYDGNRSAAAYSNEVSLGDITPPYLETFDTAESIKGWALINLNDAIDYYNWSYYQDATLGNCLVCMNSMKGENNDWAITPGLHMEAGLQYDITIDVCGYKQYPNVFRLCMGTSQKPESMTYELLPRTEHRGNTWETVSVSFTPTETGTYFLGINDVSAYNMYTFFVDNVSVAAGIRTSSPAAPTDFVVEPDPNGGRSVEISFVTPTKNALGEDLTAITKAEIYRDDALIHTFASPALGAKLTFTDNTVTDGYHNYRAMAYNEAGAGQEVSHRCFVGPNKPGAPTNVVVAETSTAGTVLIEWEAPETDVDGQKIAPEMITYTITMTKDGADKVIATDISGTSFTHFVCEPASDQTFVYFTVKGKTAAGYGEEASTMLCPVGRAYRMTLSESFTAGTLRYRYGTSSNGYASWASVSASAIDDEPQDGDDGMLRFYADNSGMADFLLPKIHIEGKQPVLTFWAKNYNGLKGNPIQVIAVDGTQMKIMNTFEINSTAWTEYSLPLDEFINRDVRFFIRGAYQSSTYTFIDNIHIKENCTFNLYAYSVSAPSAVRPDEAFDVNFGIENVGTKTANTFTLHLLRDGESIASAQGIAIEPGKKLTGHFVAMLNSSSNPVTKYGIRVDYAEDEFTADNRTHTSDMAEVALVTNALPPAKSLTGTLTSEGYALQWEAPANTTVAVTPVTESFEDYAAAATSHIGQWTLIDADKHTSGGVEAYKIGIENKQIAFFVFDMSQNSKFPDAHSGVKMMATIFNNDGANDDWLITPRLCGAQQYISFFARSYRDPYNETFELLYTTSDDSNDTASYTLLKRVERAADRWTEYGALVPEGATYFAIRCISENQFFLLIDDVTYIPANGSETTLTLLGYNVYRDYVKLNPQPLTVRTYLDRGRTDSESRIHTYSVTAVYSEGESIHSNECQLIPVGVGSITAKSEKEIIHDLSGRRLPHPTQGVNIINGKKVIK